MTYLSRTAEDAFSELEFLARVEEMADCAKSRNLCTAFQATVQHALALDEWLAGQSGNGLVAMHYPSALLAHVETHVDGCHSCSGYYREHCNSELLLKAYLPLGAPSPQATTRLKQALVACYADRRHARPNS